MNPLLSTKVKLTFPAVKTAVSIRIVILQLFCKIKLFFISINFANITFGTNM